MNLYQSNLARDNEIFVSITYPFCYQDALFISPNNFQSITYLLTHQVDKVYLQMTDTLPSLQEWSFVRHLCLEIRQVENEDSLIHKPILLDELYQLKNLQSLRIKYIGHSNLNPTHRIQLDRFQYLVSYSGDVKWVDNISKCSSLQSLELIHFASTDLTSICELNKLDSLYLLQPKVESLVGIECLSNLRCLYIHYASRLTDISPIQYVANTLTALRIDHCPKIKDFVCLQHMKQVELLQLSGSNMIPSIAFVERMTKLKTFILDIKVQDGDMSLCKNIQRVSMLKYCRHYNMKDSQLPKGDFCHGNDAVDYWRRLE